MIDINKLKGKFVEKGYDTKKKQAIATGIDERTFYNRMKKGVFNSDEIFRIMEILEIDNPTPIFFVKNIT